MKSHWSIIKTMEQATITTSSNLLRLLSLLQLLMLCCGSKYYCMQKYTQAVHYHVWWEFIPPILAANDQLLLIVILPGVIIFTHRDEVVIPSEFIPLSDTTFLSCGVVPADANYSTRWVTPSGAIVTPTATNDSRLTVQQGTFEIDRRIIDGTALTLRNLSFQDEGLYLCEARDMSVLDSLWVQATSKLELIGMIIYKMHS